jgi:hypothetical protein
MREIKFRAWDKIDKKMREVIQILWGSIHNPYPMSVDFYDTQKPRLFQDVVLMQYTGLKDKNGKEIYEGDVLPNGHDDTLKVIKYSPNHGFLGNLPEGWNSNEYEVIGNIYENKDLLDNANPQA